MSDFSSREKFIKQLEQLLPEDAHYFEFSIKYNSRERHTVMPGVSPAGLVVQSVGQDFVTMDGTMSRWTVEGQL